MASSWWRVALGLPLLAALGSAVGQEAVPPPPVPLAPPTPAAYDRPLPINLPTALQLASVRPLDVAIASERIRVAAAQLAQARVLWLPTIQTGVDYWRHDGRIQNVEGRVFDVSRSTLMAGVGPNAVFAVTDAIFAPLAARQVWQARGAELQAAANDSLLAVAEAYFTVQQSRGELAGLEDAVRRAEEVVRRTEELVPGLAPLVEAVRARTELARRRQAVQSARERWRTASADLTRILRLDAAALVEPVEPPQLRVTLLPLDRRVDDLIPIALTSRPELATRQALVQATIERLRQEKLRPLVPSVLLRGAATNPAGTLAAGAFGGGINDFVGNFGARSDFDVQLLWELQNLGLGNKARVQERKAEHQLALLELFRVQDRIAAEVVQACAQLESAAVRVVEAEVGIKDAVESAEKNIEGMGQTKRLGGSLLILVIRPQEAVASIQALALAYNDYYGAVADFNRAQFRLYRALGYPAELVGCPLPGAGEAIPGHDPAAPVLPPGALRPEPAAAAATPPGGS